MSQQLIAVAGATGNLGGRIIKALRQRNCAIRAIVRPGTSAEKLSAIRELEVEIVQADLQDRLATTRACAGAACVISTLLGLREVLIDRQGALLSAAVDAGVPRFIPSDFAMDFTKIAPGVNRNFDLHREFQTHLQRAPIRSTTILNGAFMNLLAGEAPLLLTKIHRVLYWGENADQLIDFTTMDDVASFTAEAALDEAAPSILRVAGEQISAAGLARLASQLSGKTFRLLRGGSLRRLEAIIKVTRTLTPKSEAPFPVWQGMQYLYCMFEGSGMLRPLDNQRYPAVQFTGVRPILQAAFEGQ